MFDWFRNYKRFRLTKDMLSILPHGQDIDPLTNTLFKEGDYIVICENCRAIHSEETWQAIKMCAFCKEKKTSKSLQIVPRITVAKGQLKETSTESPKQKEVLNHIGIIVKLMPSGEEFDVELPVLAKIGDIIGEFQNIKAISRSVEKYTVHSERNGKELDYENTLFDESVLDRDTLIISPFHLSQEILKTEDQVTNVPNEVLKPGSANVSGQMINIIIRIIHTGEEVDIEMLTDAKVKRLVEELVNADLLSRSIGKYSVYSKKYGKELNYEKTFFDEGVIDGDTLIVSPSSLDKEMSKIGDQVTDVPNEILKQGPAYIEEYIKRLNKDSIYDGPQRLNECKLIFIGSGEVGKTSLIKKIVEGRFNIAEEKTEGVEITKWSIKKEDRNIKFNIWDFGGQEIMHATHKFFMTRRSIYVLVINPRIHDQHSGEIELDYWLKLISSYAGNSPIIIAINKCEIHALDIAKGSLMDRFPQIIGIIETSCVTDQGIKELIDLVSKAIDSLQHINDIIPLSFLKIKENLQNNNKDYLSYEEYMKICNEIDGELTGKDLEILIGLLNDLGVMLNISDNRRLSDTQVLNPQWITNGVYSIVNSRQLFENKGIVSEDEIIDILDSQLYPSTKERGFIMDMMSHFELCFQLPDQFFTYFVPGAFPKDKPNSITEWEYDNYLHFQYKYDILPSSIISRFLVKMHHLIHESKYWRQGTVLKEEKNIALVEAFSTDRKIVIKVAGGSDKRMLLSTIRKEFDQIHRGIPKLKVETFIALDENGSSLVSYSDLISYEEEGIELYFDPKTKKRYGVKALLHGIEDRIELNELKKNVSQGNLIQALNELESIFPDSNEVLMLIARYNKIKNEKVMGIISEEIWFKEENNITLSTLKMIDDFQKEYGDRISIRRWQK